MAGLAGATISLSISPGWFSELTTSGQGFGEALAHELERAAQQLDRAEEDVEEGQQSQEREERAGQACRELGSPEKAKAQGHGPDQEGAQLELADLPRSRCL